MAEYAAACADARAMRTGQYSAWLTKVKGDAAKAKWFSSATKRYFTIDFGTQMFFYSHAEDNKTISQPVRFKDILGAEQLPRPAQADRHSKEHTYGFAVRTVERTYELLTASYADAQYWVDALNAAKDIGNSIAAHRELSRSSMSTTADGGSVRSHASGPQADRTGLNTGFPPAPRHGAHNGQHDPAPWATYGSSSVGRGPGLVSPGLRQPVAVQNQPPQPPVAPEPVPENADPFAALDALEQLAGPLPDEQQAFDIPTSHGQMFSHARMMVTKPVAARQAMDAEPPAPPAEASLGAESQEAPPPRAVAAYDASLPQFGSLAPAPAPELPEAPPPAPMEAPGHGDDSDWDDDAAQGAVQAAQAPAPAPPPPAQAEASGWDSDDEGAPAPAPPAPAALLAPLQSLDPCGAPMPPPEAFVAAQVPPGGGGDDLADLVGEVMSADADSTWHGMVEGFHCTGCDFQVMRCDGYVWAGDVDYMFFRNNYPTFEKLRRRLVRQQSCSAYCCQCSWKSAHIGAAWRDVSEGLRWRSVN